MKITEKIPIDTDIRGRQKWLKTCDIFICTYYRWSLFYL